MKTNCKNSFLPLCIAVAISTAVPAEAMQSEFPQEMRQGLLTVPEQEITESNTSATDSEFGILPAESSSSESL